MVSQSKGDGAYLLNEEPGDDTGTVESTITGVYPYAKVGLNERVSAWGFVGVGSGELTLRQKGADPMETDLGMRMGAMDLKGRVLELCVVFGGLVAELSLEVLVVASDLSEELAVEGEGEGEVVQEFGDVSGGLVAELVGDEEVRAGS